MSKMKNRRVWGISLPLICDGFSLYINYGENRYGYISWENFLIDLPTIKIPKIGPKGGVQWISIKQAIVYDKKLYNFIALHSEVEFLKLFFSNTFLNIRDKVINFKEGSYLIEKWEFIKLSNGSIKYKIIQKYKGGTIKFDTNGVLGFSVWKTKMCLEDRFWSIEKAKNFIDEGGLHV